MVPHRFASGEVEVEHVTLRGLATLPWRNDWSFHAFFGNVEQIFIRVFVHAEPDRILLDLRRSRLPILIVGLIEDDVTLIAAWSIVAAAGRSALI